MIKDINEDRRWMLSGPIPRRKRSGFLFFPKTIGSIRRWWEHAEWEQRSVNVYQRAGDPKLRVEWVNDKWLDCMNIGD